MKTQIASNSIREGRDRSRLPEMSQTWIDMIRGSADFLGINYYSSRLVKTLSLPKYKIPSFDIDLRQSYDIKPEWKRAKSSWLYSVPSGIGDLLRLASDYNISNQMKYRKICVSDGSKRNTMILRFLLQKMVGLMMVNWMI